MEEGFADDIKTFWHDFVEPRLPEKETVLAWHELLARYVQDDDAVLVIREFYNTNTTPRRGWLTKTDRGFSFTYADNGFAKLIAKMAMDGFCPKYNEFKEAMLSAEIPVPEFLSGKENDTAFYKEKKLNYAGYKLAHIVDSGKDFFIDGKNYGRTEICRKHFPAGVLDDWKTEGNIYVRRLSVTSEARDILTTLFLRYADPLNYFLSPKPKKNGTAFHTLGINIPKNDIAEYKPLQLYAMRQFYGRFRQIYKDFLNLLKIPPLLLNQFEREKACGDTLIKIHYGKKFVDVADKNKSKVATNIETGRSVPLETSSKSKSEMPTSTAEYSAMCLTFKCDEIETIDERVIIIKTKEITVKNRGSLYEAIHKWWDLNETRASRADYIFAVVRELGEIVQEVYKVTDWYKEQDGDNNKEDIDICFNGYVAEEGIRSKYKNKYIPKKYWWHKGVIGSCFYTYE